MKSAGFTTRSIHTRPAKKDAHGSLGMPVYDCAAFEFDSAEDLEAAFAGRKPSHTYSRISNPTVEYFEHKVKNVSDAVGVLAVASGMAAISAVLLALTRQGDTVLTGRHLFGNTFSLLTRTLAASGLQVRFTDLTDAQAVRSQLAAEGTDGIRAIYVETISNPQMEVTDIAGLAALAQELGIPLIADTTMTPPGLFRAGDAGVAVEVLSSTKYISGGATSIGGLVIDTGKYDWKQHHILGVEAKALGPFALLATLRRQVYRDLGQCLAPHNAYLQALGLDTLALRAERSSANALALAKLLDQQPAVITVNHPGLPASPWFERANTLFPAGVGGVFTMDLADKAACFAFMNALKLARRATNIHDNRTLVIHPASTIFCEYSPAVRAELGVGEATVRISVGIEDFADIAQDFLQALPQESSVFAK